MTRRIVLAVGLLLLVMASVALVVSLRELPDSAWANGPATAGETRNGYVWSSIQVPDSGRFLCLAGGRNDEVFIGTSDGCVLRGKVGSRQWQICRQGIKECWVKALLVDTRGSIYAATGRGVYRSVNNGDNWKLVNRGLTDLGVSSLALSPDRHVYAGTRVGVFRLDDKRQRWTRIGPPLPFSDASPDAIAVDSKGAVYLIVSNMLLQASTGSEEWTHREFSKRQEGPGCIVTTLGSVYIGFDRTARPQDSRESVSTPVMESQDGKHWDPITIGDRPLFVYNLALGTRGRIIAGTNLGPFASNDSGRSWAPMIPDLDLPALVIPGLPAELSHKGCIVDVNPAGRVYYLILGERTLWCGSPVRKSQSEE